MSEIQGIDTAIEQVERLYQSVTGRQAPPVGEKPYAVIPPERDPERHVQDEVDRLIQALAWVPTRRAPPPAWQPGISIWEGRNEFRIVLDLPGVEREGVRLALGRGTLEVSGTRPLPAVRKESGGELRYAERPFGSFYRAIPLPYGTRPDELRAEMNAGVLEVSIPKGAEIPEAETVTIG